MRLHRLSREILLDLLQPLAGSAGGPSGKTRPFAETAACLGLLRLRQTVCKASGHRCGLCSRRRTLCKSETSKPNFRVLERMWTTGVSPTLRRPRSDEERRTRNKLFPEGCFHSALTKASIRRCRKKTQELVAQLKTVAFPSAPEPRAGLRGNIAMPQTSAICFARSSLFACVCGLGARPLPWCSHPSRCC